MSKSMMVLIEMAFKALASAWMLHHKVSAFLAGLIEKAMSSTLTDVQGRKDFLLSYLVSSGRMTQEQATGFVAALTDNDLRREWLVNYLLSEFPGLPERRARGSVEYALEERKSDDEKAAAKLKKAADRDAQKAADAAEKEAKKAAKAAKKKPPVA